MKETIYYQWLPGTENEGTVSILNNIFIDEGEKYYEFTDGNLCWEGLISDFTTDPKEIKGKALVRIASPKDVWVFEEIKSKNLNHFSNVTAESGVTNFEIPDILNYGTKQSNTVKIIPPKDKKSYISTINYKDWMSDNDLKLIGICFDNCVADNDSVPFCSNENEIIDLSGQTNIADNNSISVINVENDISSITTNTNVIINDDFSVNINKENTKLFDDNDPVAILVNKAAKFESTISMDLKIELPSKSLFKIASENFENGEETFLNVILSHIDNETIKLSLKDALKNAYNEE